MTSTTPNPVSLSQDEHIVLDAQKHWFIILVEIIWIPLAALVPPIGLIIALISAPYLTFIALENFNAFLFFYSIWILFLWILSFSIMTDYYLDVVRITNKRIIDVDQQGFFSRNIATLRLDDVQDVTVESTGIIATFLKFGSVKIQSAGQQNEFVIKGVRHPDFVRETIIKAQGKIVEAPQRVIIAGNEASSPQGTY
ncbi:MAG TPA: PH domain-containing protein [Candidatus Paceibacterota bacterium]|nr:PH domain-containing protein [Candidatus Paceibacterota bacterium]